MRKIFAKFVPRVLREDQKERRCHDSREMVELINSDPAVLDALVTCDESWIDCYDQEIKRQSSQWKHADSPRLKKTRQSKSTHNLLIIFFFWKHWLDLHALGSHWTDSRQGTLCWDFKGVQEEIPSEEASTHQIGSVAYPPVHKFILVRDYLTKMGIKTVPHPPYSPDLTPCYFWLFPKLRGCRYETIEVRK